MPIRADHHHKVLRGIVLFQHKRHKRILHSIMVVVYPLLHCRSLRFSLLRALARVHHLYPPTPTPTSPTITTKNPRSDALQEFTPLPSTTRGPEAALDQTTRQGLGSRAERAATALVQEALRRGTTDNVTAVVSLFQWN